MYLSFTVGGREIAIFRSLPKKNPQFLCKKMGNQVTKIESAPEQNNDRLITYKNWIFLQPFLPYFEDQLKADAMRIEQTYETQNYCTFGFNDLLRIYLRKIPKEELSKYTLSGEKYSPLEKYISFDRSVCDLYAACMACKSENSDTRMDSAIVRIKKETESRRVLSINWENASILLSPYLRLNLIQKYFTKPFCIREGNNDDLVLSWIRIPTKSEGTIQTINA